MIHDDIGRQHLARSVPLILADNLTDKTASDRLVCGFLVYDFGHHISLRIGDLHRAHWNRNPASWAARNSGRSCGLPTGPGCSGPA